MLPVSSNSSGKTQLLQKRQENLAKWKQKKAEHDQQKKIEEKQHLTNKENSQSKHVERLRKLEEWKRKKRERDQEKLKEKNTAQPDRKRQRKHNKVNEKHALFDLSDDETNVPKVEIFKPTSDNVRKDQSNSQIDSNLEAIVPFHVDSNIDPFDEFMQTLQSHESHSSGKSGDFLDPEDNELELEGVEKDYDDANDDANYTRIAKLKMKKHVAEVTYTQNDLERFRKSFYLQPEELGAMSESEANELRLSLGNMKIRGTGCPLPITRWSQLGLTTEVMNFIIRDLKYEHPTPIQAQAIPAIMSGRDVIGISKTGSGKTISYLLPMLRQIKAQRPLGKDETGPLGLVLAPTRELALQIHEEVEKFTKNDTSIHSICCTGGSELKQQINNLKRGVEVVVATPGRFIDLLTLNAGKLLSAKRITFVVMDEADRLFDLGFEPQITQIMKTIRPDKQCVLFSATFPNKLRSFAMRILDLPLSITVNSNSLVNENVTQKFNIFSTDEDRYSNLLQILEDRINEREVSETESDDNQREEKDEKIIIFVSSQQICDLLYAKLESEGYDIFSIHAGKPYQERISNLEGFRATKNGILLCTEVLSRGLNVPEVSLVIIYNAVKTFAQYVHTTGRTARGTHSGEAITLLLDDELASAYIISKAIRDQEIELHDSKLIRQLREMSNTFESGIKNGKYRISQGFGGKGLDNMESKREEKQTEERKKHENKELSNDSANKMKTGKDEANTTTDDYHIQVPKLQYTVLQNSNPDGTITFSAEVNVNDLPQLVRWEATKNTTLMFIKHETGCSITNKGKYYPEGKSPQSENEEPKLYLLIESQQDKDIRLSIDLLEQKVKEGVRKVGYQSMKDTKY